MSFDFFDAGAMLDAVMLVPEVPAGPELLILPPAPSNDTVLLSANAVDDGSSDLVILYEPSTEFDLKVDPSLESSDNDGEGGDEEIVITGTRPQKDVGFGWETGGGGGGTGGGPGFGEGEGGGGGDASSPGNDLSHPADCSSIAGAADQIRDAIVKTKEEGSAVSSSSFVEFGTIIVRNSDGSYGAVNNMIYTDDLPGRVDIEDNLPADLSTMVGIIHNHPGTSTGDYSTNLFYSYPSAGDWQSLANLSSRSGAPNPSIWLIDAFNNVREFRLSDRQKYESLSEDEMRNAVDLPAPSAVQGCS